MFDFKIYRNEIFLKILEDVYQIEKVNIFKSNEYNDITTFYRSKKKKGNIFNMPFNFYYSPLISKENENIFFSEIKNFSIKKNTNIIIKSLYEYDIKNKSLYANNPIIHLQDDKLYSKNLKQSLNRNINKCGKFNINISKSESNKDLKVFYETVLSVMYIKKHKMVFQPFNLYKELLENDLIDFFIAKKNEEILGGLICIKDEKILHYNWGASLNYENIAIGTVLINYAIEYAKFSNYEYFDLGSTSLSDKDLYSFKMKWGAINYPVYEYYTLNKPSEIDLNNSYKFARNIYSKFPKPFLRWLMPKIIPWLVQ